MTNSGNLQTAYTEKTRIRVELSTAVQQQWQLAAVCTVPYNTCHCICNRCHIPHTLHDVLKRLDLNQICCMWP